MDLFLSIALLLLSLLWAVVFARIFYVATGATYTTLRYYAAKNGYYVGGLSEEECRFAKESWRPDGEAFLGKWMGWLFLATAVLLIVRAGFGGHLAGF